MEIYLHRTDGGAEYYTTKEDDLRTTVLRTDGDEFEMMSIDRLKAAGFKTVRCNIFTDEQRVRLIDTIGERIKELQEKSCIFGGEILNDFQDEINTLSQVLDICRNVF